MSSHLGLSHEFTPGTASAPVEGGSWGRIGTEVLENNGKVRKECDFCFWSAGRNLEKLPSCCLSWDMRPVLSTEASSASGTAGVTALEAVGTAAAAAATAEVAALMLPEVGGAGLGAVITTAPNLSQSCRSRTASSSVQAICPPWAAASMKRAACT